jgi:hypothetical protein
MGTHIDIQYEWKHEKKNPTMNIVTTDFMKVFLLIYVI